DPEATARKARAILQAAYAPGNPSAADMQVAQKAYLLLREAEEELKSEAAAEPLANSNKSKESIDKADKIKNLEPISENRRIQDSQMIGYAPTGKQSSWYDFWLEREESQNRGLLFSILI
ncbi:MAG: hypothetical protein N2442_00300, partial [Spirochaetes bacterium]|nr:hypothetical protein [Spirochaetota bacterium]